jgi:dihydroflavonol-4-reductase
MKVPFDLAAFAALFTTMYYNFAKTAPRFTPYALEVLRSNANISHAKATHELGYQPRPLYESIRDAVKWFLEKKK